MGINILCRESRDQKRKSNWPFFLEYLGEKGRGVSTFYIFPAHWNCTKTGVVKNRGAHWNQKVVIRAGASTTRVLVLPKIINMNILKTLYSSTTRVLIFQYSYSYVQYSPQPWSSYWQPSRHWLHPRLSIGQPQVQPVTKRLSIWRPFCFQYLPN